MKVSSNLNSIDKLRTRHVLFIVIIGLVLHFQLVFNILPYFAVILVMFIYMLLYLLSTSSNTILSGLLLRSPGVMKVLLYLSSLMYTSTMIEILNYYGLSIFQSTMLIISTVLIFQAISANLDHILVNAWKITILDLHILIFTIIAVITNSINNILRMSLLLFIFCLLFIRLASFSIYAILPIHLLTNGKELTLLDVFILAPLIAYAYGYASAVNKLASLTPYYDNKSLLAVIIVSTTASIFTMYTYANKLMYLAYYMVLFIMFCYYTILAVTSIKKINSRK